MDKIIYMRDSAGNVSEYLTMPAGKTFMEWCDSSNYLELIEYEIQDKFSLACFSFESIDLQLKWILELLEKDMNVINKGEVCRISSFVNLLEAHNLLVQAKKEGKAYALINLETGLVRTYKADNKVVEGVYRSIEFFVK